MKEKVKMGMMGGSLEGFIGPVHRIAARMDGEVDVVCGVFSRNREKSLQTAEDTGIKAGRVYSTIEEMLENEKNLPPDERMDFLSIVTPNNAHYLVAKAALESGFNVFCEKPVTLTSEEARSLKKLTEDKGLLFGLMHNYTGYPMIKEAREIIRSGKLGKIRKIIAEYPQGWLSAGIETGGQRQASWRTDPSQAGISCCVADIGTHAENLLEYVTGLKITELAADIHTYVEGRQLEDDANIMIRMENDVKGVIIASQIAAGEENELKIRIYGENGGLEWLQSEPNTLTLKWSDKPREVLRAGSNYSYLSEAAKAHCRLPGGHPEGYLESMANIYRNFAFAVRSRKKGMEPDDKYDFPTIQDGLRGMLFIEAVIESARNNSAWRKL